MKTAVSTKRLCKGSLAVLTLFFLAVYCGVRSLPVEPCDFLHSQDTLGDGEGLEYCGPGESSFIDLDKVRFPLRVEVRPLALPIEGETCQFLMTIHNYKGQQLTAADFALSHTEKVHLLCVDESLMDYQHVHPQELRSGEFGFSLTPKKGGVYKVFLDFIIRRSGSRVLLQDSFRVEGPGSQPLWNVMPEKQSGDYSFALRMPSEGISAGQAHSLELKVWNSTKGEPARLEPVMGAFAHLVAFDADRRGFAHFHPLNEQDPLWNPSKSALQFSFSLDSVGAYRLWAQVKLEGQEVFVPFDLKVI